MLKPVFVLLTLLPFSIQFSLRKVNPEANLPTQKYCEYYNYPLEIHYINTTDQYILKYFRIQQKNTTIVNGKPPVLLHHGLFDNSDTFLINEEAKSPAFVLANAGYDVWLANTRGNMHSRNHTFLNPDKDNQFWDFSFEDMSKYDLPAAFEYISNKTGFQKIDYIGHSQGSTIMFVALSEGNKQVEKYLGKFLAFGPAARIKYEHSTMFLFLQDVRIAPVLDFLGVHELLPYGFLISHPFFEHFCALFGKTCRYFLGPISETDARVDNYERMDVLVGHNPGGSSMKNIKHWIQGKVSGKFQKYDYGKESNMKIYGQELPPEFNLQNIKQKVYLFTGQLDPLADQKDVEFLKTQLKQYWEKSYYYGHCTFMWGNTMEHLKEVLQILKGEIV